MTATVAVTEEFAAKLIASRARSGSIKNATVADLAPIADSVVEQARPTRPLADIERDLGVLVKTTRRNIFKMGALLIEAKARVDHGEWLPWLQQHFGGSESTAQNYMKAARYLVKNPTVGDLKLSMGAIYFVAGAFDEPDGRVYGRECMTPPGMAPLIEAKILETAKTAFVDEKHCYAVVAKHSDRVERRHNLEPKPLGTRANPRPMPPKSPEEKAAFQLKMEHQGRLMGSVKAICALAPKLTDLFDGARIDNNKLVEASAVLLAVVAAREARVRGDDPRDGVRHLAAAMRASSTSPCENSSDD